MGFFKNIGKTIKKASKQISFKNLVKIGTSLDPTGVSGGIFGSIEAKKEEKKALKQQQAAQLEYEKQIEAQNAAAAEKQRQIMEQAKSTAEFNRMLVATNTQAVGGKVGVIAGSIGGDITKAVLQTASNQVNQDFKTGVAKAGANLANSTLNEWLKVHWWKVLVGVIAVGFGLRFLMGGQRR